MEKTESKEEIEILNEEEKTPDSDGNKNLEKKDKEHNHNKAKMKIAALEEEIAKLNEKVKYHQAELINYRKRKDEETSSLLKFANQDLIMELIPVLDNFERAIKLDDNNLNDELSKFLDGFKMMYAQLVEILKRFGVEEIDCLGKAFDPSEAEALMIDHEENQEDNVILEVLLKGYRLKDRVIRPAAVKVNKKIEKGEDKNE